MILITGATGFTGSYVLRYLVQHGHAVRAIHRSTSDFTLVKSIRDRVEWVEVDLLDVPALEKAMADVTHVYHTAAMVSFRPRDNRQMMQVNVEGTANVVNLALNFGIEKLLHVSSVAALGKTSRSATLDERTIWQRSKYNSPYAVSKFRAEREVWRAIAEGLNAVILNPSIILGGGFWHEGTGRMFSRVAEGLRFFPMGGTSLIDVRDVARIAIQLMESDIRGERFVATQSFWTYKDLLNEIAKALEAKPPSIAAKPWLTNILWRLEEFRAQLTGGKPTVTRHIARGMQSAYRFKTDKLRKILNPNLIPIEQTIRETASCYSATRNKKGGILPIESRPLHG